MAARVAILLLIAASRGIFWILEQPKGSLFEFHPQIQAVFTLLRCYRKHIHMRDFGAGSQKPTWLYSGRGMKSCQTPQRPIGKSCTFKIKSLGAHVWNSVLSINNQ